MLKYRIST